LQTTKVPKVYKPNVLEFFVPLFLLISIAVGDSWHFCGTWLAQCQLGFRNGAVLAMNYPLYFFASEIAGTAVDVRMPDIDGDPATMKSFSIPRGFRKYSV